MLNISWEDKLETPQNVFNMVLEVVYRYVLKQKFLMKLQGQSGFEQTDLTLTCKRYTFQCHLPN